MKFNCTKMLLRLVNDNGIVINVILWLFVLLFVLIICITFIQLIQLCISCHRFVSSTVYIPAYKAYKLYQNYMQITPLPVIDV
ncbi:envelope [alphacoronavirus sp. WA3607]|uniref:Envelope small membrane protein n=1 Tax=alphacoronavirus sp. WA3607 TaxID=3070155 RepID=A0AA48Z9C3_9ALPC|nr:envelope [Alphacoronavirus sp.]QGX41953.1 envelope [alphacoronavirus sp. WA3607]